MGSNASAIGGGCNKIHLVAGLEELVAARSVPEPYLVSLHDATVAFNAKQSRRKSISIFRSLRRRSSAPRTKTSAQMFESASHLVHGVRAFPPVQHPNALQQEVRNLFCCFFCRSRILAGDEVSVDDCVGNKRQCGLFVQCATLFGSFLGVVGHEFVHAGELDRKSVV